MYFPTKERLGIQRIDIYGVASISELRISLDGVSFNSIDIMVNDEKSNASYLLQSQAPAFDSCIFVH